MCITSVFQYYGTTSSLSNVSEHLLFIFTVLYSNHDTCILIPVQQWVLPTLSLCILDVRPSLHEVLVSECSCQFTRYSTVHVLHDFEICRKENVEVALLNLRAMVRKCSLIKQGTRGNRIALREVC
jgi:hypothetical protein